MQIAAVRLSTPIPLPLLARAVSAGFPSPADDFIEAEIDLQSMLVANRAATFLMRVRGDSMVLVGLHDGDVALIDRSLTPVDGDVVVVDIDNDRSFKVYGRRDGRVTLNFANLRFPKFELDEGAHVEVWGVVVHSIHTQRRRARG